MKRKELFKVVVICSGCGKLADFDLPTSPYPWNRWHTENPCPHCGTHRWCAHNADRDWKTGKVLE